MRFSELSGILSQIEVTTKRLEMTYLLADLFKKLSQEEVEPVLYLLQGKLVPKYESKEFQISTKMIIRALSRVGERTKSAEEIETLYKQKGDLGVVADEIMQAVKSETEGKLTTNQVYDKLKVIAEESGEGSQERKLAGTVELLNMLDHLSAKYVVRVVLGKLRLGFSDMTMIDALSWAVKGDKSLSSEIEDAYQKRADIGFIAKVVLHKGAQSLHVIKVAVGTPIIPALCQRLNSAKEIIEKMSEVYAEPKYDGTRVQMHIKKNKNGEPFIRTYTRNLEDSSHMFPELKEAIKSLDCETCILDAEAIGYDSSSGNLLKFQQTIQRKRKHGVEEVAAAIPLRFFIFDVLEKDGKSLIDIPLSQRKVVLEKLFEDNSTFVHSPFIKTADPNELHAFHEKQLAEGLEGAVIKTVNGVYQSGRKAFSWVKIKESEGNRGKLSDTVDCIVMGYYLAKGDRTEFVVGSALVGILNEKQEIVSISKVGSGFSEDLSREFIEKSDPLKVDEMPKMYHVHKQLIPDVWLLPKLVIEVAADEITISPTHTAELALRFPRIIRFRADKNWDDATTLQEVKTIMTGS